MQKGSTLFLKGVIVLLGLTVLTLCVYVLPVTIGSIDMDGYDPILMGMYVPAIPFFIVLYHSMKVLNFIDKNQVFTQPAVNAFKYIKYCGVAITGLYVLGLPYIFHVADKDDAPGVVAIALVIIFASVVITTGAGVGQRVLQNAVDIKSENDLTV